MRLVPISHLTPAMAEWSMSHRWECPSDACREGITHHLSGFGVVYCSVCDGYGTVGRDTPLHCLECDADVGWPGGCLGCAKVSSRTATLQATGLCGECARQDKIHDWYHRNVEVAS